VLQLAKVGAPLRYVWSWPDPDLTALDPAMVIVAREPDGRWYVTFTMDTDAPAPLPQTGRAVGVDLGVRDFAVTSDGRQIPNPRHLERKARNLARYQRRMARCQAGSANRAKAASKVARAHRKVRTARRDFLHRTTTRLVRENDVIAMEDLAVQNMRRLARAISDCGWGEFRRQLEYKCQRYGRELVVIDRWYPSSKTCSTCGHLLARLSLSARHWTCPACGARHHRDINAAKNILAAGRAVARGSPGDACGADIRHSGTPRMRSAVNQELPPARAGIPVLQGGEQSNLSRTRQTSSLRPPWLRSVWRWRDHHCPFGTKNLVFPRPGGRAGRGPPGAQPRPGPPGGHNRYGPQLARPPRGTAAACAPAAPG
jgi:putative transposase